MASGQALTEAFGITNPKVDVDYGGRTDLSLVREFFQLNDIEMTTHHLQKFLRCYHNLLPACLKACEGLTLPGVEDLLHQLKNQDHISLGLVTGNSEEGARQKLDHHNLWRYFDFGGYGHEAEDRNEIALLGRERAEKRIGPLRPEQVIIIGDTPRDVDCARAIGARVICVLTGFAPEAAVREAKPDLILTDLLEIEPFLEFL
jgi:phosphoglycolate phosphatase